MKCDLELSFIYQQDRGSLCYTKWDPIEGVKVSSSSNNFSQNFRNIFLILIMQTTVTPSSGIPESLVLPISHILM